MFTNNINECTIINSIKSIISILNEDELFKFNSLENNITNVMIQYLVEKSNNDDSEPNLYTFKYDGKQSTFRIYKDKSSRVVAVKCNLM